MHSHQQHLVSILFKAAVGIWGLHDPYKKQMYIEKYSEEYYCFM